LEADVNTRDRSRTLKGACLAALLPTLLLASCENMPATASGPTGHVNLAFVLPGGTTVSSVAWKVFSSTSAVLASGIINTTNPNSTPTVIVGLPAGTGDTVTMTTTTSNGASCSGTSAPFSVVPGQMILQVPVTLTCGTVATDGGFNSVVVSGTIVPGDNCPALVSWSLSPQSTAANGGTIDVSGTASDSDTGDTLSYTWSATAGTFGNKNSSSTTYTCAAAGSQTLTLSISDNHMPAPCVVNVTFPTVDCTLPPG
jgi:hypothetical protein